MKIIAVVGARPSFMKAAAFLRAAKNINVVLVHTGQHYDYSMSEAILTDLLVKPDYNLNTDQVGKMIDSLCEVYRKENPDCIVVFGDTNSTLAAALAARIVGMPLCHVEAGLRCGDMSMPEEMNRVVTDILSDLLLAPSIKATENLQDKSITGRIVHVGNIMVDTMDYFMPYMKTPEFKDYCLLTLHRQSNVDNADNLRRLVDAINRLEIQIVWPLHPRTKKQLTGYEFNSNIHIRPPASYLETLGLISHATMIITDSGGIQAEAAVVGVPCVTVRDSVEWEETLEVNGGTAVLADASNLYDVAMSCIAKDRKPYRPLLWDGMTAERCLSAIWNRYK